MARVRDLRNCDTICGARVEQRFGLADTVVIKNICEAL